MSGLIPDDEPGLPDPEPSGPGLFGDMMAPVPAPAPQAAPYRVLARKYRPTGFGDLIGQDAMVRTLRNAFTQGRVAHAFMLTGVRGVGKTTTARIIARALNCIGPDGQGGPTVDACGVCANCVAILADRHPDVTEMDAASNNGVDKVREIIEQVRFRPMQARTRVFILDEVHMLSGPAFNALLKTLEEPPPHVKFIFATTEIRKVPVTVLSRCQRFDLRRIGVSELAGLFTRIAEKEHVTATEEALLLIARAADGSARDGLSLLDQAIAQADAGQTVTAAQVSDMLGLAGREAVFDLFEALMEGRPADALAVTDRAHANGADLGVMLQDLLELVHVVTRMKAVPALRQSSELPEAERVRGGGFAERLTMAALGRAWQMLLKGSAEVEAAPDRRAAAEMVLIRLCYLADVPTPGDLVRRLSEPGAAPAGAVPSGGGGGPGAALGGGDGGGARAVANGAPMLQAAPGPRLASYRDVTALVAERRDALLHAHLVHSVHLVRFAPPVIELRPQADTPRDLAGRLSALLQDATGTRWTIAISQDQGEPTLAEQAAAADTARRDAAIDHPLVRAILEAFPGAKLSAVTDSRTDSYGLLAEAPAPLGEDPDMPDFAPLDAEFVDDLDVFQEYDP